MSLHALAHHVQSSGRGDDSVLVHMTPGEVKGLQALAVQHGGSLTINPHTGLPEAGFLSSLIPVLAGVAGVALAPFTGGASLLAAPLLTGAITAGVTGSLSKGLMAGLGAWGAGGIATGLMEGVAKTGLTAGLTGAARLGAGVGGAAEAFAPRVLSGAGQSVLGAGERAAAQGLSTAENALSNSKGLWPGASSPLNMGTVSDVVKPVSDIGAKITQGTADVGNAGTGLARLMTPGAEGSAMRSHMWENYKLPMAAATIGTFGGSMMDSMNPTGQRLDQTSYTPIAPGYTSTREYDPSSRAPGSTAERSYYAKDGGLMSLADGGPVENMGRLNSTSTNTGYPMAYQNTPSYATSSANPVSENVIRPQGDSDVDPYSGEERMASGGMSRDKMLVRLHGMLGHAMPAGH